MERMEVVEGGVGKQYHLLCVMENLDSDSLLILSEWQEICCCDCCKEVN